MQPGACWMKFSLRTVHGLLGFNSSQHAQNLKGGVCPVCTHLTIFNARFREVMRTIRFGKADGSLDNLLSKGLRTENKRLDAIFHRIRPIF